MTLLGINVKATADFSDIEREAERASARVKREFQSPPTTSRPSGEVVGGHQQGAVRQVDALQRALERTHQTGLKLRNIKLPVAQFGDAEKQIRAIERQIALLHTSPWGKDLKQRLIAHGEDLGRPFKWRWDRLYGGDAAAGHAARDQFYRGAFHVPTQALVPTQAAGPSAMSAAIGNAIGRFVQHSGARAGGMVGGAAGAAAGDAAAGAAGGGLAAAITRMGPAGIVGGLAVAVAGKLGLDAAVEGHREYLRTLDSVDTMLKQVGGDSGFKSLQEQVRQLGGDLHMAGSEAGQLARSFIATSGAMDASTAFERVGFSGSWGRGMGLEPEAATTRFARASLVGYGQTKSEQREFALLLGQTIGGSGMFARTEQVMDDLVGQIEHVATQQLRTANSGEVSQLAKMLETLYQDPAMRGGGSGTVMDALQRAGGKGGFPQEVLAWQAFGEAVGWDPAKVIQMQEATPFTSPFDLFGEGFTKQTRAELAHEATKAVSALLPGDAEEQYAYHQNIASGTPIAVGRATFRLMEDLKARGGDMQGFRDWVTQATGRDIEGPNAIEPAAYGPLSKLWALRGDDSESAIAQRRAMAEEYLEGGNVTPELAEAMRAALDDGKALAQILPKAAASAETMGTAAEQHHKSVADLTNQLVRLGDEAEAVMMAFRSLRETMVSGLAAGVDVAKDGASVVGDGALSLGQRIFKAIFPDAGASTRPAIDVVTDERPSSTPAPEFIFTPSSTEPVVEPATVEPSATRQTADIEPSATRQTAAVDPRDQGEWNRYLRKLESERGLEPGILSGIEEVETGAWKADPQQRATITNPTSGATGWFQFKPATAERFGIDPHDPVSAARGAADYLEANAGYLRQRGVEPTTEALLASFYAGEGAVAKAGGPPAKTRQYIADAKARMAEVQQARPVRQTGALRRVDEDLAARVEGFLSEAKARGYDLSISSGYRSQQEQDDLRKRLAGTDIPVAKRSKHTRGAAVDVALPGGSADDALRDWAPGALERWGLKAPFKKRESPEDARSRHWHLELAGMPSVRPPAVEPAAPTMPTVAMAEPTAPTRPAVEPAAPTMPPVEPAAPTMPPVEQGHQEAFQAPGVAIDYQGDPNFVYGKTASATAKPFSGIVLHHTGTESLEKSVSTGKVVDPVRKGAFGYHFYIGKDGEIVQGAPLSKRTNHVQPKNASGLKNNELLGIALVGTGEEPTRAQLDSLMALGVPLSRQFGIKPDKIFGHAQIQSDKGPKDLGEGVSTAKALREALAAPIVADDKADTSPAKDQRLSGLQQVAPVSDPATLPDIARLHGAFTDTIAKTASVTEPERRLGVPNADSDPSRYIPRIPPDLERAVAATTSPQAIDARWQGQVSMDLTFRDARGNAVQRRHMLTVSEPRIPGSGGSDLTGGRFSWNDTVTVPSFT